MLALLVIFVGVMTVSDTAAYGYDRAVDSSSPLSPAASTVELAHQADTTHGAEIVGAEPSLLALVVAAEDVGLSTRGLRPLPGTRVVPEGIPENWRITGTDSPGGVRYYEPSNPGNSVRVMQGNPNSPYPNSRAPYVRWQQNGQPLDLYGNKLPSANDPAAHIPLDDFTFLRELFE